MKPADFVGRVFHGPAACWSLSAAVLESMGKRSWEPVDAMVDGLSTSGATDAICRNVPDWWAAVEPGEEKGGDFVMIIRDGAVSHCGVVLDGGWVIHHTKAMGARRVTLRSLRRAGVIDSVWRPAE
jgi:hypothetical protein